LIVLAQDLKSPLYQLKNLIIDLEPINETEKFIRKNIDQAIAKGQQFLDPEKWLDIDNNPDLDQTEWTIFKVFATNFLDDNSSLKNKIEKIYYEKIFNPKNNFPEKLRWEFAFWDKSYILEEFPYAQSIVKSKFLKHPWVLQGEVKPRTELFMRTFFCSLENPFTWEMFNYTVNELPSIDNFRYELTHALMVLHFAKERNCFDQNEIKKGMDKLALKIKEETPKVLAAIKKQQIDSHNYYDIFAEMVAFLLIADYPDYVKPEWLQEIIMRQNQDGGWPINGQINEKSSSHGAVVSLLALHSYKKYYLQNKKNDFGWLKELPIKNHLTLKSKIDPKISKELSKKSKAKVILKYKNENDYPKILSKINTLKKPVKKIKNLHLQSELSISDLNLIENDFNIESAWLDVQLKGDVTQSLQNIDFNLFKQKYPYTGKNIKICLVDSGVDLNQFSYIAGYDFVNDDVLPEDESGHGTLVAKILKTLAPESDLIVAKVLDKNNLGFSSNVLKALDFCKENSAQIINLSLGGGQFDGFCDQEPLSQSANDLVLNNNIFIVASAGNDGLNNYLAMPACASQVFSVGSVDKEDKISSFSDKAAFLDMFAPGENINIEGKSYSGTSFAAPFVSGAGALYLQKNPSVTISNLKYNLKSSGNPINYYFSTDKIGSNSQVLGSFNNQNIPIARLNIFNLFEDKKISEPYDYSWYWQANESQNILLIGGYSVGSGTVNTDPVGSGGNSAPSFSAGPSDQGSSGTNPTNAGSNVTFTATGDDPDLNNYYLAICKTNAITPNDNAAPTCGGGSWCISASTASGSQASCNYTTSASDAESNTWYAFVCDYATGSLCSSASQGTGDNGSPFKVNHRPSFSAINDSPDPVYPNNSVTITATASDSDTDTASDTVKLFVCSTNSLTSCSAGCASTALCTAGLTASNPSCNYSVTYTSDNPGVKNYWGFICDNHNFSASSSQAGSFTINPALSFSISSTSVNFGTLSSSSVSAASITITTSTNASNGYITKIYTNGNFKTAQGFNFSYVTDASNISVGDGKYGIGTSKAGQDVKQYTSSCASGASPQGPLSGSTTISNATSAANAVSVASSSSKISNDTTTICFVASPSPTTPAGNYSHIITFVSTGKF